MPQKIISSDESRTAIVRGEDLIEAGVTDPAKVARVALQNAASIAGLMLTTDALIADVPTSKVETILPQSGGLPLDGVNSRFRAGRFVITALEARRPHHRVFNRF
jgi:hypothetical protein